MCDGMSLSVFERRAGVVCFSAHVKLFGVFMFGFSAPVLDAYSIRLKKGAPALSAEVVGTLFGKEERNTLSASPKRSEVPQA